MYNTTSLKAPDIVDAVLDILNQTQKYGFTNVLSAGEITEENWNEAFKFYDNDMNNDGIPDYIQNINGGIDPATGEPWNLVVGEPPVSYASALERLQELQKVYAEKEYQRLRVTKYPTLSAQFAALYDDINAGLFGDAAKEGIFYKSIKNIKDRYPSGT